MRLTNFRNFRHACGALAILCALASAAAAQHFAAAEQVKIKNFGQMDARFHRGAQPRDQADYRALAALGINTVINLRHDAEEDERRLVEQSGMRYVNLPMLSKTRPTDEQARAFLALVNDPATGKFFVHCAGGRHRTGAMGAVYRYELYGWNFDQVYEEMKRYDFYTMNRHQGYKDFVRDYYERLSKQP